MVLSTDLSLNILSLYMGMSQNSSVVRTNIAHPRVGCSRVFIVGEYPTVRHGCKPIKSHYFRSIILYYPALSNNCPIFHYNPHIDDCLTQKNIKNNVIEIDNSSHIHIHLHMYIYNIHKVGPPVLSWLFIIAPINYTCIHFECEPHYVTYITTISPSYSSLYFIFC